MKTEKTATHLIKDQNHIKANLDEIADLKRIDDLDNKVKVLKDDLIICTAQEEHVKEISELWANLATIQQLNAPSRYNFKLEDKDWQIFIRKKLAKKNNLLLAVHRENSSEVRGFLYLQTVAIPSSDLVLKGVIEDLYIKPQYRRQKIASMLLDVSLEWAKHEKVKKIDFISVKEGSDLSKFYSGYVEKQKLRLKDVNLELVEF